MRLALRIVLAAIAALAIAAPGRAETPAGKVGRITADSATSKCIGARNSPLCATETLLACLARAEPALCHQVGVAEPRALPREAAAIDYVIERVSVIKPDEITDDLRDLDWFKPGYALVELQRRSCIGGSDCADESWESMQVYLRPHDGRWDVVMWRDESEPDVAPELPDSFAPAAKSP